MAPRSSLRLKIVTSETTTHTHCPYCAFQCGVVMTDRADHAGVIDVRPDDDFPVNRGQMCIKGFTSAALLDHPERLTVPKIRGRAGRLLPARWDTALDFVAERLLRLRELHGPAALAAFGSGALTNEKTYLLGKFARLALQSPNVDYNGRYCMSSAAAGQNKAFGIDRGLPFPVSDIAHTKALLLWGANCAETLPPIMQWIFAQRDNGGALIVVDPRRTDTARAAALHLQPTPGSDLALANGLLYLALEEKLIDTAYIAARTDGFDDLRRAVLSYHPAHVERLTGVSTQDQLKAVRLLAEAPSSMLLSGRGPEQQSKGADTVLSFINLMLALGKVGKPYSGYGCLTGQGNGQGGREHGQKADQLPGYRHIEDAEHRAAIARVWGIDPAELPAKGKSAYELLDALGPEGGIRALLVFGSNVAVASPNALNVERRLASLDLLVVCDAFVNETARDAHVLLPVAQFAEEEGTMTNLEGRVILRQKVRPAPPEVKTDIEIFCELARRLGAGRHFQYTSAEQVFDELRRATAGARADYSGITYDKIRRHRGVFWPCPSVEHPGTPRLFAERFHHPNGRARFHAVHHRPAAELPDDAYPFYFTTGRYKEHYNSGAQTRRVSKLEEAKPEPKVEVHPRLAARLGVVEGDSLLVESRRGAVTFRVAVVPSIRPDTLFAPFHWGGRKAANVLTVPALDPTSRMPEFKVCAVRARRVSESN
ncbi:molybdopterin oxidoreductase family protein [Sorangium sp. So ce145]|uniref:molybdopterin oxidoreductase family protein n=1 Tax=Sorangium sp. So ce145 TaxID=3133285 RepID=UPI003F60192E